MYIKADLNVYEKRRIQETYVYQKRRLAQESCAHAIHLWNAPLIWTKETYTYMKRDLCKTYVYEKTRVKETTCTRVMRACDRLVDRDFFIIWQKTYVCQKRPICKWKETYTYQKRRLARDSCAHAIHSWIASRLYHHFDTSFKYKETYKRCDPRTDLFFTSLFYIFFIQRDVKKRCDPRSPSPFWNVFWIQRDVYKRCDPRMDLFDTSRYTSYKETYQRGAIQEGWCLGPLVYVF